MVMMSRRPWVGCSWQPSPALITGHASTRDRYCAEPLLRWRTTSMSIFMAARFSAVSRSVSPLLKLLVATEKKLDEIVAATSRAKRALRGKEKIGLRVGKVLNQYKVAKHFVLEIDEGHFTFHIDEDKVAAEAMLDGLYVIRTSLPSETVSTGDAVRHYKDLSRVEAAFRSLKSADLQIRPIHQHLRRRSISATPAG